MGKSMWKNGDCLLAALGLMAILTATTWADEPATQEREVEPVKPSEYWVGLACVPAGRALQSQLGLKEGQGLLVESVMPDGPAAKAGIKPDDVLVSAGNQLLLKVQDLINAVDRAKGNSLGIKLYRAGKSKTVDVAPTKRPDEVAPPTPSPKTPDYRDMIRRNLDQLTDNGVMPPLRFRFFHPGAFLAPGGRAFSSALPDDMSVTVSKHGDEPARVTVDQGDQHWEVTPDELSTLPDDVRGPVERLLARDVPVPEGEDPPAIDFLPEWNWRGNKPGGEQAPKLRSQSPEPSQMDELRDRVENLIEKQEQARKQLESQFQERFEELRNRLEELRENRPRLRDREKNSDDAEGRQEL